MHRIRIEPLNRPISLCHSLPCYFGYVLVFFRGFENLEKILDDRVPLVSGTNIVFSNYFLFPL